MATKLTEKQMHKIGRIDRLIGDFFEANPSLTEIPAMKLMPVLIQQGIFFKNYRGGLPIRLLLQELDKENKLSLLKHTKVIRDPAKKKWYFAKQ